MCKTANMREVILHKVKETKSTVRCNTAEDDVAAAAIRRMRL